MGKRYNYGNFGKPQKNISKMKYWVWNWGQKTDETSKDFAQKYYRLYLSAGGKLSFQKIVKGKEPFIDDGFFV